VHHSKFARPMSLNGMVRPCSSPASGLTEWGPTVILRRKNFVSAMSHMGLGRVETPAIAERVEHLAAIAPRKS
jgi:hypothetical protein